jgi:hypothetical protein
MNALPMSRAEFIALLPTPRELQRRRRKAEERRLRVYARLTQLIAAIADQHPGTSLHEVASILPPDEATMLLELIDRLDHESRVYGANLT